MTAPVPPRSGVRRSRSGAVLGGVCAGVARSAGLDPLLLRIAVVAVTLLTGGAGLPGLPRGVGAHPARGASAADVQRSAGPAPTGRHPCGLVGRGQGPAVAGRRAAPAAVGGGRQRQHPAARGGPGPGDTSPGTTAPADTAAAGTPTAPSRPAPACREPTARPARRRADRSAGRRHPVPALAAGSRRRRRDRPGRAPARTRGAGGGPAGGRQRDAGPGRQRRRGRQAGPPRPRADTETLLRGRRPCRAGTAAAPPRCGARRPPAGSSASIGRARPAPMASHRWPASVPPDPPGAPR